MGGRGVGESDLSHNSALGQKESKDASHFKAGIDLQWPDLDANTLLLDLILYHLLCMCLSSSYLEEALKLLPVQKEDDLARAQQHTKS